MNSINHQPPKIAQSFLRWYCKPELVEDIEGDIHEDFNKRYIRSGKRVARFYYLIDVIRFFRPFAIKNIFKTQVNNAMFRINTLIAFRNLIKHKLYSFINITGLAIGIAACLVITQYVIFQLSFDRYHADAEQLYRVNTTTYQNEEFQGTSLYCGFALGPALGRDVPEFETFSRVHPEWGGAVMAREQDGEVNNPYFEEDILYVDPTFLDMFTLDFLYGQAESALTDPNSIAISESKAKKYFGDDLSEVVGQTLRASGGWLAGVFKVSGIFKDVPANSHLRFDFLKPIKNLLENGQYANDGADWGWTNFFLYAKTVSSTTEKATEAKIADLMQTYDPSTLEENPIRQVLSLEPIVNIHLKSEIEGGDGEFANAESIDTVYFLIAIAVFILVIAWINFINLSTAKAIDRGLEVGIKKAMGAIRGQLISQFLTESFWINMLAVGLAVGLAYLTLPLLGNIIGETLSLDLSSTPILLALLIMILAGPLLAGIYPAFVLSSFKAVSALKGAGELKVNGKLNLRRGLVIFQFVISALLTAGTFVVYKQLNYMRSHSTGIDMSQILVVKGPRVNITEDKFNSFKNTMSANASVESFASSRSIPGNDFNFATAARAMDADATAEQRIDVTWVDENFLKTFDLELVAGRNFTPTNADGPEYAILSESSLKTYGLGTPEEALTRKIIISGDTIGILGVVEDHNWRSLHQGYTPSAFLYIPATVRFMSMRINTQNVQETIKATEDQFIESFPGNPFEYYFLDDFFNRQYETDQQFGKVFNAFAGFAIFAACLGLFGLASYSVARKAKEIGIRRVLGASSSSITLLFSRNYLILILIANAIAVPVGYFGMKRWLQNFAFSIPISIELFLIPIALLLVIAAVTVSLQTIRATMMNPAKNLRSE